jgi:L-asparaginase II
VSTPFRILVTRGDLVESYHDLSVAVTDRHGRLLAWADDPERLTYWRSAAKPFQALPLLEDGGVERFGLATEELALACASHSSESVHLEITDRFLAKIGCSERDLACGPHPPLGPRVSERRAREAGSPTPKWSNCSGKHSGMLALAKVHGWPTKGYEGKDHPVQRRIIESVLQWTGAEGVVEPTGLSPTVRRSTHLHLGVDGCQAVCFGLTLSGMARAYAALGEGVTPELTRLREAMTARPDLVAGTGRTCTDVMRAAPGKVVVKLGADGVYCGALIGTGLGFALKVHDGDMRALPVALVAVLDQLSLQAGWDLRWERLVPQHGGFPIQNTRQTVTGQVKASGGLQFL